MICRSFNHLLIFYIKNNNMLPSKESVMNDHLMTSHYLIECNEQIEFHKKFLTSTEYTYAKEVILALSKLDSQRQHISSILDEGRRNQYITNLIGLIAEPGLIPGHT